MMKKLLSIFLILIASQFVFAQAIITHEAPMFNGATSSLRSPNGTAAHTYFRGASIIPSTELLNGIASGTSIKKFGFTYNVGASVAVTGTLKVYMMNTTDATFLHTTIWDSVVAHSVLVYNGSFTIPASAGVVSQDVVLNTPFSYTGNGMYVAYDWYSAGPYASVGAVSQSNNSLVSGVKMASSTTSPPTTLTTGSSWRPVMRFGYDNPYSTDAKVVQVYTYGKMPVPTGNPHHVNANIKNQGGDTLFSLKSYLNISGVNNFVDSLSIDTLLPGADKLVSFGNFMATSLGSNTVTVSVPSDQNTSNNSMTKNLITNNNSFSFSQGTTADGNAGFNSATGDFVAKFTTSTQQALNQVDVNFATGGNQFKIGIWSVDSVGKPDTLTYQTAALTSTAGVYTIMINPPLTLPAGSFFVGVRQIGTTNIGFQYQNESPIRTNTFFYVGPSGGTTWVDFAPSTPFRFMIEPKFALLNDVGINALSPASTGTFFTGQSINIKAVVANYGFSSQSNISVSYKVNGGSTVGPITLAGPLITNDTASVVFSGANAFVPTIAGTYTIKVFSSLVSDLVASNDTMSITYTVLPSAISTFPYHQNFDSIAGWTTTGPAGFWVSDSAHAAVGNQSSPNPAIFAAFYDNNAGTNAILKSPVLNLTGLTHPMLRFHVAYRSYITENDSLQVLVSNDYGSTYLPGVPQLYLKSNNSSPSLATLTASTTEFVPDDSTDWRLETVDLTQFASSQSIMIAFKGYSQYGNNCWIDNVVVKNATAPILTTTASSNISVNGFTSGGNVIDNGGRNVTAKGLCWSTSANPTITNDTSINGLGNGAFTANISGLLYGTTYYVRAYATNNLGTSYGNEISVTTLNASIAVLTTNSMSNIDYTSAISGGDVTSNGGDPVTLRGLCWSTSANPTITNDTTINGSGLGVFVGNLSGLTAGTTYYVRAYAINTVGTAYGNELVFNTLAAAVPMVSTNAISGISIQSAMSGGEVTLENGASVTDRGVCWSTSANPTISDSHTSDGSGMGTFVSNISGLTHSTLYYLRAYATNATGTAYGSELSFNTLVDGIDGANKTAAIQVFIVNDVIYLNYKNQFPEGQIQLSDLNGKVIDQLVSEGNSNQYRFQTHQLAKGVYFIRFNLKGMNTIQKLIIQ